jgi:predicted choloylglycine hydrolase
LATEKTEEKYAVVAENHILKKVLPALPKIKKNTEFFFKIELPLFYMRYHKIWKKRYLKTKKQKNIIFDWVTIILNVLP